MDDDLESGYLSPGSDSSRSQTQRAHNTNNLMMLEQKVRMSVNSQYEIIMSNCAAFFDQFFRGVFGQARHYLDWLCCVLLSASYCVVLCCVVLCCDVMGCYVL